MDFLHIVTSTWDSFINTERVTARCCNPDFNHEYLYLLSPVKLRLSPSCWYFLMKRIKAQLTPKSGEIVQRYFHFHDSTFKLWTTRCCFRIKSFQFVESTRTYKTKFILHYYLNNKFYCFIYCFITILPAEVLPLGCEHKFKIRKPICEGSEVTGVQLRLAPLSFTLKLLQIPWML